MRERWRSITGYLQSKVDQIRRVYHFKKNALLTNVQTRYDNLRTAIEIFLQRTRYEIAEDRDTIVVTVGVVESASDKRRAIVFEGKQVAQLVRAEGIKRITETLYWIGYGASGYKRYLIHTRTLHRTKGLRTILDLREVREADLALGNHAPLGRLRPLSLREAL